MLSSIPNIGLEPAFGQARYFLHRVQRGETLYSISRKYGVSVSLLKQINNFSARDEKIKAGYSLKIPIEVVNGKVDKVIIDDKEGNQLPQLNVSSLPIENINSLNEGRVLPTSVFGDPLSDKQKEDIYSRSTSLQIVSPLEDISVHTSKDSSRVANPSPQNYPKVQSSTGNGQIVSGGKWYRGKSPKNEIAVNTTKNLPQTYKPRKSVDEMLAFARKFLGTPYVYGGDTPAGFDCSGYVQCVCRYAGVDIPRIADEQYYRSGVPIPIGQEKPGDLVFFETDPSWPGPSHVGIFLGDRQFIHASSSGSVRIDSLDKDYYHQHFLGSRRVL